LIEDAAVEVALAKIMTSSAKKTWMILMCYISRQLMEDAAVEVALAKIMTSSAKKKKKNKGFIR
jgi:hypothetical protein